MKIPRIKTLSEFVKWIEDINTDLEPEKYLFRGLSNEEYQIEASAWRRLPAKYNRNSFEEFLEINRVLIKEARLQGLDHKDGRELMDLEILAELQHFQAATCLIDFTYSAQVALWFACQPDFKKTAKYEEPSNGKVGAVLNDPSGIEEITPKMLPERDLDSFFNVPSRKMWRYQLYRWQPRQLSKRIIQQHSVFLLGGGPVIYPDEECIIEANCKEEILKSLENSSHITGRWLFPDLEGFASQHAHDNPYLLPDYMKLGNLAYQRSEYEEAILNYNKAIRYNSKDANAYYGRGCAKVGIWKYDEAIDDFDKVIEIRGDEIAVYRIRGYAKSCLDRIEEAKVDYLKGLELAQQTNNERGIDIIQRALHELNSHTTGGN